MRLLRSLLSCVMLSGLGIIALLFLVQNLHTERIVFFGMVSAINFAWVVAGAAALGFLLALMLIVPGRIATALYARMLDRQVGQLEEQVAQLSEQRERLLDGRERLLLRYERLFADHDKAIAERERMRAQLAATTAATAASAAAARQPLALRERDSGTGREVRAAPVRIAPLAVDESSAAGTLATANVSANTAASANAGARSSRILPPVPAAPDPPTASRSPTMPDPPVAPPDPPVDAGTPNESVAPPAPATTRASQVRESAARYTAGVWEQLGQWRSRAGRVRQSASTRYNDMRTTLRLAGAHAIGRLRQDASQPDARSLSASAASARDEDRHERTALKGEQPLWRPPE